MKAVTWQSHNAVEVTDVSDPGIEPLLDVRARPAVAVRDDAGERAGIGRIALRLHEPLRLGPGWAGGVPPRPPGPVRACPAPAGGVGRPSLRPSRTSPTVGAPTGSSTPSAWRPTAIPSPRRSSP